jgi:hypothetical protein
MRSLLVAALVLAGAALTGCPGGKDGALPRNPLATAEETVKAYCDRDAQGARLTSATWSQVLPYISWTEEAGWDRAIVIAGYRISGPAKGSDRVSTVPVEYDVLGVVAGDYTSSRTVEKVTFTVEMTERGWKISGPDFMPPHVLARAMAEHLEATKDLEQSAKVRKDAE